ncbi:hypothetical protein [Sinomonas mesophila]|uniref:hypothetical protein n=1 Tax=Sinomonas mesophila TaxID=1531955 RepID=UPI0009858ADB|nr:hypothetical protein [Sinomonas mesophila]
MTIQQAPRAGARPTRTLAAAAALAALAVLSGCRAGPALPPSSGDGAPGLNASGQQRSFSPEELVETAAQTRTALKLGGTVLDHAQLAAQGEAAVPALFAQPGPAECAAVTAPSTATGLDAAAAALILAPSDSRARNTAVGLKSHADPGAAAAEAKALAEGAAACARYDAALGGQRVPVVAAAADPGTSADGVMVTATASVPDPSGGSTPQQRGVVHAVAVKGTVTVEVLLVDARPDDAAAAVRAYVDMAFARLPL